MDKENKQLEELQKLDKEELIDLCLMLEEKKARLEREEAELREKLRLKLLEMLPSKRQDSNLKRKKKSKRGSKKDHSS